MNDKDIFGLGDKLFQEQTNTETVATIIEVTIRVILAMTTAGFFYVFAGDLMTWLTGPMFSPYLTAGIGVFCIDVMAWAWNWLKERHATTATQMQVAKFGMIADLAMSALITGLFFVLLTDFVTVIDPTTGQLNTLGQGINLLGLFAGSFAIVGNGLAYAYYAATGIQSLEAKNKAELRSAQLTGQHIVNKERSGLIITRTLEGIQQQLPPFRS